MSLVFYFIYWIVKALYLALKNLLLCGSRAKNKNPLPLVCLPCEMLSEIVCHAPVAQTATEEIDYRGKDWMQAQSYRVGTGNGYYPSNSYRAPTKQPLKISSKLVHLIKRYSWFSKTQTDRHTDGQTPTNHPSTMVHPDFQGHFFQTGCGFHWQNFGVFLTAVDSSNKKFNYL